jgi:hypothetical protein
MTDYQALCNLLVNDLAVLRSERHELAILENNAELELTKSKGTPAWHNIELASSKFASLYWFITLPLIRHLINLETEQNILHSLKNLNCLFLSLNHLILKPDFKLLFSQLERTQARKILDDLNYTPPKNWLDHETVPEKLPVLIELSEQFQTAMLNLFEDEAGKSINYRPIQFKAGILNAGGVAFARQILGRKSDAYDVKRLYENGRLSLSVEALTLKPEFTPLFNQWCYF